MRRALFLGYFLLGCAGSHPPPTDLEAGIEGDAAPESDAGAAIADAGYEPGCGRPDAEWSVEQVDATGRAGMGIGIGIDSHGIAHLSYRLIDDQRTLVRYATNEGGVWRSEELETDTNSWTSLAIDGSGDVHVAFSVGNAGEQPIHVWERADGGWSTAVVGTGHGYGPLSMTAGAAGLNLAYFHCLDFFTCFPANNAIAVMHEDAGEWQSADVAPSTSSSSSSLPGEGGPFLAAGPRGALALLVAEREHDASNQQLGGRLALWELKDGEWIRDIVASRDGEVSYDGALAVDGSGNVAIAFAEIPYEWVDGERVPAPPFEMMLARKASEEWQVEQVEGLESPPLVWGVAVDRRGGVSVLYREEYRSGRLATNACGAWETSNLDGEVSWAALALEPSGRPAVAFFRPEPESALWLGLR